jgi:hypothetical protein
MKTRRLFYIIAASTIGFAACGSNEDKKATPAEETTAAGTDDSTEVEVIDTVLSRENIDTFSTMAFSNYAKKQATSFDWSHFRMVENWEDDSLLVTNYKPDKKFFDAYGRYIKYSPDSSMFVDMDSYHEGIKKNNKGKWQGLEMEADSEVSLVNLKSGKKTRLLFLGPDNSIEDALWLDKENLAIMGVQDYGDSLGKVATVWKFNIPTNTYFLYEWRDSSAARRLMGYWRKERMKDVLAN